MKINTMLRYLFTFVLSTLLLLVSCHETTLDRKQVKTVLDSLENKLEWLDYRIARETLEFSATGASDSLDYYNGLYKYVINDPALLHILKHGRHLLNDENTLRQFELLRSSVFLRKVESSSEIVALRDSLAQLYSNQRTESDNQTKINSSSPWLCCNSNDSDSREKTYKTHWTVGERFAKGFGKLVRLRNKEARRLGYNNYLSLSFAQQDIELHEYLKLLNYIDSLSIKPYEDILHKAQSRISDNLLEIWDLGLAYRDINQRIDVRFPYDSQLVFVRRELKSIGFNLDKLPIYFDLEPSERITEPARFHTIKAPYDVRVTGEISDGIHSTYALIHEIGKALHRVYIFQDRALYINTIPAVWSESMARSIAALCNDDQWLINYAGLPLSLVESYKKVKMEQSIMRLRMTLVNLMFEYEVYSNPNRELNKLYWDLFEHYMMLPRHDDIKPWAATIEFTTHPVSLQNYLYADIIAAQIVNRIEQQYTNLSDNKAIGPYLTQNYFRFGARYDWSDLLNRGTGEKLNPDYFIKHFGI